MLTMYFINLWLHLILWFGMNMDQLFIFSRKVVCFLSILVFHIWKWILLMTLWSIKLKISRWWPLRLGMMELLLHVRRNSNFCICHPMTLVSWRQGSGPETISTWILPTKDKFLSFLNFSDPISHMKLNLNQTHRSILEPMLTSSIKQSSNGRQRSNQPVLSTLRCSLKFLLSRSSQRQYTGLFRQRKKLHKKQNIKLTMWDAT